MLVHAVKENFPHANCMHFYTQTLKLRPKTVDQNDNTSYLSAFPTNESASL
jgi:hypothetical protein